MAASMTDQPFVYTANPGRVLFGFGMREKAAEEARLLGAGKGAGADHAASGKAGR